MGFQRRDRRGFAEGAKVLDVWISESNLLKSLRPLRPLFATSALKLPSTNYAHRCTACDDEGVVATSASHYPLAIANHKSINRKKSSVFSVFSVVESQHPTLEAERIPLLPCLPCLLCIPWLNLNTQRSTLEAEGIPLLPCRASALPTIYYPLPSTTYSIANRKSKNRKFSPLPTTIYQLPTAHYQLPNRKGRRSLYRSAVLRMAAE